MFFLFDDVSGISLKASRGSRSYRRRVVFTLSGRIQKRSAYLKKHKKLIELRSRQIPKKRSKLFKGKRLAQLKRVNPTTSL